MPRKKNEKIEIAQQSLERMLDTIGPYLPEREIIRPAPPTDWRPTSGSCGPGQSDADKDPPKH